jgi:hypothetical protein
MQKPAVDAVSLALIKTLPPPRAGEADSFE